MSTVVWHAGALVDERDVRISPFDHGLTVGDGVFETLLAIDGVAFAARRHLERLRFSAAGLGLDIDELPDDETLRAAMSGVVRANGLDSGHARVRITVTAGPAPLGSGRGDGPPTVVVAAAAATAWDETVAVVTVPWPRNEHSAVAGLKTTSYAENVIALAHAGERGGAEAIFANTAGNLCEGTGSNVFVVVDGELLTPPLTAGCLAGVTRALVLEATDATERDIPCAALGDADEAFLTSTTRGAQPIATVDGRTLRACPGPLTAAAAEAYARLMAADIDP